MDIEGFQIQIEELEEKNDDLLERLEVARLQLRHKDEMIERLLQEMLNTTDIIHDKIMEPVIKASLYNNDQRAAVRELVQLYPDLWKMEKLFEGKDTR